MCTHAVPNLDFRCLSLVVVTVVHGRNTLRVAEVGFCRSCRQLVAEVTELRAGKESQGTAGESTRTSGSLLKRLGRKMTKDRSVSSKLNTLYMIGRL